jgi:hypothetical protein
MSWLDEVAEANRAFVAGVKRLPQRGPGPRAVITCMDSRINLAAIGMPGFDEDPRSGSFAPWERRSSPMPSSSASISPDSGR